MSPIRRLYSRFTQNERARKAGRAQLKAAKTGDHEQYLSLISAYIDIAHVYFGSTLAESVETRSQRASALFLELWKHIQYAERLSDFEYMLASALIQSTPNNCSIQSPEPLVTKVRRLAPDIRFALLAYEFEKWPIRWVKLVMRMRPTQLHRLLAQARCELCGVNWDSLALEERNCLAEISLSMDESPNIRRNQKISAKTSEFPQVTEIKAEWLELHPQLVEVRHRFIPTQPTREKTLETTLNSIIQVSPIKPPFMDRIVNSVHFSRHETIKIS